jgi:hypothetical protein
MLSKPIWCKCKKHSWTRRQLYAAWEKGRDIRCPSPGCERAIPVETIERLLIDLGMVTPDDTPPGIVGQG